MDFKQTAHSTTGDYTPLPEASFGTLQTLSIRCGPTQHDYWQGQDSESGKGFAHLLFCRQCGDVIEFKLDVPLDDR